MPSARLSGTVRTMSSVAGPRWGRLTGRTVMIVLLATLGATVLASATRGLGAGSVVAVFMLAVTISAVSGGLWGGVLGALLAAIAFPILEEPDTVLRFDELTDLIAVVVFLAVAIVVGLLVGNVTDERARATRREREARLLAQLSAKLLSGDVPERVLDDFVQILLEPLGLALCEVRADLDGHEITASATAAGVRPGGPSEAVPLVVANDRVGVLIAERPAASRPFSRDERLLLEAAVLQAAVALDRARLEARARLAQVDAETNELRAAMFSSVTHDLRTPLASIKAGVTSLLDPSVHHGERQQRDLLQTVLEETDRLNRLVGNILDLAKIRAGALIPRRARTAVDEVAEAVVGRIGPRAAAAGVRVELDLGDALPEIAADPMQLDQVMTNLLENAVRHSPGGGVVRLQVGVVPRAVRVRVTDEGAGIDLAERERVFEAFYRGQDSPESPGAGLGLAIAKAVVTAHGGKIWVEPAAGRGTTFVFDVPIEESVVL